MSKKAGEDTLALLHSQVAQTLVAELTRSREAALLLDEFSAELPEEVVVFLSKARETVSPALLQAAIKFLKDNDITADPTENEDLLRLQSSLDSKRAGAKAGSVAHVDFRA